MPLHRSLTLWLGLLGLLGLLFLLGAWVDSTRYATGFQLRRLEGSHQDGTLDLTYRYGPGNYSGSGMERVAFPKSKPHWFGFYRWQYATGFFVRLLLPHWLLILSYTAIWLALLVWRQRRIKRARRTLTAPA